MTITELRKSIYVAEEELMAATMVVDLRRDDLEAAVHEQKAKRDALMALHRQMVALYREMEVSQ